MGALLAAMEEAQAGWSIPDMVLRANLRDALSEDFLPVYEGMLQRNAASASRVADKQIRYQVLHRRRPTAARSARFWR